MHGRVGLPEAPELVAIRQFGNMSEALLAQGCLDSAGVECFQADANISRLEWPITRGMRLQVNAIAAHAEDAESRAAGTIAGARFKRPIAQLTRNCEAGDLHHVR